MLTRIIPLLASLERAQSVAEGVTVLLTSVREQLAGARADMARRGDPTGELDRAIGNLAPAGIEAIVQAITSGTDANDELVHVPDSEEAEPIVDPNTIPPETVVTQPEPKAPPIVDPNTVPNFQPTTDRSGMPVPIPTDSEIDETADGEFPSLKTWLAYGYLEANYEKEKAEFYASQERRRVANVGTEPGQGEAGMPVLDVAPVGKNSDELNASGINPAALQSQLASQASGERAAAERYRARETDAPGETDLDQPD